jgi:uncharacterized membrane protein YbaN (DUF454 family)
MKQETGLCTNQQCLRPRPLWQRVVYPSIGLILILIGLIGSILPVLPGFPFVLVGIPLFACFHPKFELWVRRKMHAVYESIKRKIKK